MNQYRERCRDCVYLVEGDNGEWVCDNYSLEVEDVSDDICTIPTDAKHSFEYILWKDFVRIYVEDLCERHGGLRKVAEQYHIDPSTVSKMKNGKVIPTPEKFKKYFHGMKYVRVEQIVILED